MKLAAVVPGAGLSRRMGREKLLLPFGNRTILETVLARLREAGVAETIAVMRPDMEAAAEQAKIQGARVVFNLRPDEEMLVSVLLGVRALSPDIDAFFLWPVDHPAVSAATLAQLAAAGQAERAAIPCYRGRRGHPVLIGQGLRSSIEQIPPGEGLRYLWRLRPESVVEVEVDDPGILVDLDTPVDYESALHAERRREKGEDPKSPP